MQAKIKRSYEKPQLTSVTLMPEEAVLGGCKTAGVVAYSNPGACSWPASCIVAGS